MEKKNCLSCKWEPEWDDRGEIPLGLCRYQPLPIGVTRKWLGIHSDGINDGFGVMVVDCPAWQKKGIIMNQEKLTALITVAKSALTTLKQAKKYSEHQEGTSIKRHRQRMEQANICYRQLERDKHELHCLAVELGVAKPEPSRYGTRIVGMAMGRELKEVNRSPEITTCQAWEGKE